MSTLTSRLFIVTIVSLATLPNVALSAPAATSPYYTDKSNSYVQDQVSKDMEELNGFLCMIGAMAPDQMVNKGDYIAMVDLNACKPSARNNSQAGGSSNQSNYLAVQLNSSRASNTAPMLTKIWANNIIDQNAPWVCSATACVPATYDAPMYVSASQAPSSYAPYGVFRLDYCKQYSGETNCTNHIGYIDATRSGLSFYTKDIRLNYSNQQYYDEFALQLSSSTSTSTGSGIVIKTDTNNPTGTPTTSAIIFANNNDYFYRNDGINPAQCFDRSSSKAKETVWRYGLYDMTTGERFNHQSGFPIKFVDASGTSFYGYIGFYGYWLPYEAIINSGDRVYQVNYNTFPPSEIPYTFHKSGGRLDKYTTYFLTLADLDKSPFYYYAYSTFGPFTASNAYYIYWDKTANQFFAQKHYNSTTYQWDNLTPVAISNAAFAAEANNSTYGISGNAPVLGNSFTIKAGDIAALATTTSATRVITTSQDVVYPKDFAALNTAGGLKCIGDCPTAAQIAAYNADLALTTPTYTVSPFINAETYSWNPTLVVPSANLVSYYLDSTTGNLRLGTPPATLPGSGSQVIQTATNYINQSGKMISATDLATITTTKACGGACSYSQSDIDLLANTQSSYSYYQWSTGAYSWQQMAFLTDSSSATVPFYPSIPVLFTAPNSTSYGQHAGESFGLYYGDFGNLWGIPYGCIDLRNNQSCVYAHQLTAGPPATYSYDATLYTDITPSDKQYYGDDFSIPYDTTLGVVTTTLAQGSIAKGTQFLVKALDKEVRLLNVNLNICSVQQLGTNITVTKLPSATQWIDPTATIGAKPVLNPVPAPRVIHGVVQY
jgi:hypothetical protein